MNSQSGGDITITDFRTKLNKINEEKLIEKLINNDRLYIFIAKIIFKIVTYAKQVGMKKEDIQKNLSIFIIKDTIVKVGYQRKNTYTLINIDSLESFISFNKENGITLIQLMGSFYKFCTDNQFVKLCIDNNKELQIKFMKTIYTYFKIPSFVSYDQFQANIINKSYGKWFYLWTLTYLTSNKQNLFHRHVNEDPDYVRIQDLSKRTTRRTPVTTFKRNQITRRSLKYSQFEKLKEKTIVRGNTFVFPKKNGIWINIMKKYKKQVIAGPSGSAVLTYQLLFDITKVISPTYTNKIMLLLAIITEYYQYYHSISEVLFTYSTEAKLPTYTLDMNDLEYLNALIDKIKI